MQILFKAKVPKDPADYQKSEDRYRFNRQKSVFALSDGASQSYNSRLWAALLCQKACAYPEITQKVIQEAINEYHAKHPVEKLSWSQTLAFERGSFATLLTVRKTENKYTFCGIGDSVVLICDENKKELRQFPLTQSWQFDTNPELLSTKEKDNTFLTKETFAEKHCFSYPIGSDEKISILLMTDALGQWCWRAIEEKDERWHCLLAMRGNKDRQKFRELILDCRSRGEIKVDDTTLIHLK